LLARVADVVLAAAPTVADGGFDAPLVDDPPPHPPTVSAPASAHASKNPM
jgi:hypothetical protein